jgi:hypothetical protein
LRLRFEEVLGDGFGVFHVGLAGGGEFGVVVASDAGVVDEELDAFGFFLRELLVEAGYVFLVALNRSVKVQGALHVADIPDITL